MEPADLHAAAEAARGRAHAPYSGFGVGAALLTGSGEVVTAANLENASLGLTICAERAAVARAVAEGHSRLVAVAVAAGAATAPPCGACRQVLHEFGGGELAVTFLRDGRLVTLPLAELLPVPFEL